MNFLFLAMAAPAGQGQGQGSAMGMLFPLIIMIPIFYLLVFRPQQKKQKQFQQMLAQLKKNDKVVTSSGIHGLIVALKESTLSLKISDNVKIEVDKSSIARVIGTEEGE